MGNSNLYRLDVRQQPRQARLTGPGEKAGRRTLDPAPIVQLQVRRPTARRKAAHTLTEDDWISPSLTHTHFMFASLVPENSEEELYDLAGSRSEYVGGTVVSSLLPLRDQSCFVFPDLCVRTEGRWRLKMSMYEIVDDGAIFCDSILTEVFQVYSSKRFPGMSKSAETSKTLAREGLKLRMRRTDSSADLERGDTIDPPRRKKAKTISRKRPNTSSGSWQQISPAQTAPSPPPYATIRRSSGSWSFSHAAPLVAPIGSTTSTPQQRPWTSWNAVPTKIFPHFTATPVRETPRPFMYDYHQTMQQNSLSAPQTYQPEWYSRPRPPSSQSHHMPPPSSRPSPAMHSKSAFPAFGRSFTYPRPCSPPTILAPIRSHPPPPNQHALPLTIPAQCGEPRQHQSHMTSSSSEPLREDRSPVGYVAERDPNQDRGESSSTHGPVTRPGGLAMLLGEGAQDPKQVAEISFF
ncbi:uncharacterized protein JCM15063_000708 [Sporobolomyces koalae]|uniref:uncharacterized protein n=1 Tax=Sporobolomyces koalae TaxID=500713 RepID=UPI00316DADC2